MLVQQRVEQYRGQMQVKEELLLKQREKKERVKAEARLKAEFEEKSRTHNERDLIIVSSPCFFVV